MWVVSLDGMIDFDSGNGGYFKTKKRRNAVTDNGERDKENTSKRALKKFCENDLHV